MANSVLGLIVEHIDSEIKSQEEHMVSGRVKDYVEYQQYVSVRKGLLIAREIVRSQEHLIERDD